MSLNVSTTPVFFRQGLCLPDKCSQAMYNHYGTVASEKISTALDNLITNRDIDIYIVPPDVRAELSFIDTSVINDKHAFNLAIKSPSGNGSISEEVGVYGPSHKLWLLVFTLLIFSALIIIVLACTVNWSRIQKRGSQDVSEF